MRGSLVHDAIYQLLRMQLIDIRYRLEGDIELRRVCLEDGMCSFRAWYVYHSVRAFAAGSADPEIKKM